MRDNTEGTADTGAPEPPDVLIAGRYLLGALLGNGAVADVYRAVDTRLDRHVAVKVFHPGQDTSVRARFGAEAQALARLCHPGLVGIFDAGVDSGRPYLVMQFVDGETLRERLLGGPLTTGEVVRLGSLLAAALAHVHANDVVHRDVKPSNIVLDADGAPHLADFGIALLVDVVRMTGAGEIMGTAAYLAPEQIVDEPVDAAADVYSLGLVLIECLTGELEYPGVSRVESALARLGRPPRVPAGIPGGLSVLLTAMTARVAADRPSATQCATRLVAVAEKVTATRARRHAAMRSAVGNRLATVTRAGKGSYRTSAPLLSGWRRFVIAGSGIAMAIIASTWLFTSLLPRVSPQPAADTPRQQSASGGAPGVVDVPEIEVGRTRSTLRVAAALPAGQSAGSGAPVGTGQPTGSVGGPVAPGTGGLSASVVDTTSAPDDTTYLNMSTQEGPVSAPGTSDPDTSDSSPSDTASSDTSPTDTTTETPTTTPSDTSSDDTSSASSTTTPLPTRILK